LFFIRLFGANNIALKIIDRIIVHSNVHENLDYHEQQNGEKENTAQPLFTSILAFQDMFWSNMYLQSYHWVFVICQHRQQLMLQK